jgi:hypothetical protein
MTVEKPWIREYEDLLRELQANWQGEVREPRVLKRADSRPSDMGHVVLMGAYRAFHTKLDDVEIVIDISEDADWRGTGGSSNDNIEYLRVMAREKLTFKFSVRREGFFDRLSQKLLLAYEFQTGNKEFDRRYFLELHSKREKQLMRYSEVQEAIMALAPLSLLSAGPWGVIWSQMLEDESQLLFPTVSAYAEKVAALADLLGKLGKEIQ